MNNLALAIWLESLYQSGQIYKPEEHTRDYVLNDIVCSSVWQVMQEHKRMDQIERLVEKALHALELHAFQATGGKLN
jgi:hypothetical protein